MKTGILTSLALSTVCVSTFAQTPLQPKHVAMLQSVSATVISPDGKYVAYNLSVPRKPLNEDDGRARSHLYVVNMAGNARPFVTTADSVGAPQWTHDGTAILYTAKRDNDEHPAIYRIPIDGGESVKVIDHTTAVSRFSLHPDGQKIAFLATEAEDGDAKALDESGFDQEIFEEDWHASHIWLSALDDDEPPQKLELPGSVSLVRWSHSGGQLAVVLAPTPSVDDSYMAKQVVIVDAETGDVVRKILHASKLGDIRWSPDDQRIAMIAGVDINDPKDGRLMIVSTSSNSVPQDLMPNFDAHINSFAWNGEASLIWTAGEGTLSRIGMVTLDGESKTLVAPNATTGVFSTVTLSDDGSVAAITGHSREHYVEAYRLDVPTGKTMRLTDSNPWLEDIELAKQETIEWRAADGIKLQGVLVYPIDHIVGRRYPMIMVVHGGPESHESDGWTTTYSKPGHIAAARGFFVFYPNYRGSTGRGVEFSKMGQADAAGKEFSDLIAGIDHLVERGLVDKEKVGITGGSYGGYASAWGATYYSDQFAASVMFVGISDNVSKVGTTDIPNEMFLVHHRKRLWDDWDYFLKSSPIRYVQRNRTPTLILHGKNDPRVHPSQSLELHRHLKTLGQAPVRLVLYEGEGHGNRKAAARFDYNLRLLRWMEHFLLADSDKAPPMAIDYKDALGIESDDEIQP